MKLSDILAKVAKGDALDDEEKKFAGEYDEQRSLDAAAANARKKAEKEAKDAKDALEKLQGEFDEFKSQNDPAKKQTELDKALTRIAKLEKENADAKAQVAARDRTAKIRALAKEAGINPAKGVSSETIDLLVDNLMAKIDIEDADAVKAAFDGFKSSNAGLIAANTVGGIGLRGQPANQSVFTGKNPFLKDSFNLTEQLQLKASDPAKYAELKAAAESK
jgi:ATPase subunit of ABC transporter with duplicated ATPase domains